MAPWVVGANVYLSGCGYQFIPAQVRIVYPTGYVMSSGVGVWSSGCLDNAYFTPNVAGSYAIQVYQMSGTKRSSTLVLKASTTLTVT